MQETALEELEAGQQALQEAGSERTDQLKVLPGLSHVLWLCQSLAGLSGLTVILMLFAQLCFDPACCLLGVQALHCSDS